MEGVIQGQPTALRAIKLESIITDMSIFKLSSENRAAEEEKRRKYRTFLQEYAVRSRKDEQRLLRLTQ